MRFFQKISLGMAALCSAMSLYGDELKIGGAFMKMDYVETSRSGEFLDSEKSGYGDIGGFYISYSNNLRNIDEKRQSTAAEISLRYLQGDTKYDGFLQSTVTGAIVAPYKTTTQNTLIEPKIRLKETTYTKNYDVSMFVSLGYREWSRDIQGPYGLKEIYEWGYYDIGLAVDFFDGNWELGFEAGYQKAISPKMTAYLKNETVFDLGDTKGYYILIPLGYNFDKNWKAELTYEYNEWSIEASNVVNGYYEPDSITQNQLLGLNLVYIF